MNERDVIYDWNVEGHAISPPMRRVEIHDETLRDGIQCPSVKDPSIDDKFAIVRLLAQVGVDSTNVGLPGAGPRATADSQKLVELIRDEKLPIRACAAARTHANDITATVEISQRTGVPVEAMMFLGSSPIRMYAEGWDEAKLEELTRNAVKLAVQGGIPATFVTEDTVRSHPRTLRRLFTAAVEEGATRLVLCDTCGHATPNGVFNLVHWTEDLLAALGVRDEVKLDWHGHNDRGHALPNALYAIEAGCDRVHGCVLGIGERVGNTSLDQLMVNMKLIGVEHHDLSKLADLVNLVSKACDVPIPYNYPVFGTDAFRTGTGVHAAAVVKAIKKGENWLADRVYSGVPASWFGRAQEIEIGHMSGESNVRYWLTSRKLPTDDGLVRAIFDLAKARNTLLSEKEVMSVVEGWRPSP
jgi:2-isopropylmalate synthase